MRDDQIPNDSKSYDSKKNRHMEELNNLYQETLHRKPDSETIIRNLPLLKNDKITIAELKQNIYESQEYFERIILDKDNIPKSELKKHKKFVCDLYKDLFYRKPDKRGLKLCELLLASGHMTKKELRDKLSTSDEKYVVRQAKIYDYAD